MLWTPALAVCAYRRALITGASSPRIVAHATLLGIEVLEKPPTENDLLKFVNAHRARRDR